jgi:large subunit ribosomal protein L15
MKLNEITDNKGARYKSKRVGRGIGSGKGKTAGRGGKGQTARTGVAIAGFEGGQTPLHRRLPKIGFTKPNRKTFAEVTLARLQTAIDSKKLDTKGNIDAAALKAAGVVRHVRDGVRLLATGKLTSKVTLTLAGATEAAVKAVEAAGGSVTVIERKVWLRAPRTA